MRHSSEYNVLAEKLDQDGPEAVGGQGQSVLTSSLGEVRALSESDNEKTGTWDVEVPGRNVSSCLNSGAK